MNALARKIIYICSIFIGLCFFLGCAAQNYSIVMKHFDPGKTTQIKCLEHKVFEQGGDIKDRVDVIYLLELGTVYSFKGNSEKSNRLLEEAYRRYTAREEEAILSARKAGCATIDVLFGEGSRDYELADYEKVYIHTIKAMNYLMLGDVDSARVETMRGIERHRMIREYAEFESAKVEEGKRKIEKQIEQQKASVAKQQAKTRRAQERRNQKGYDLDKDLRELTCKAGLPPDLRREVMSVRNSYENSFTYLMAALDFGLTGEDVNVGPQLRNADALADNRYVRNMLSDYKRNSHCMVSGQNCYVFAQVGRAPTKENLSIPFPNPFSETVEQFSIARIKASHTNIGSIDLMSSGSKAIGRLERLTDMKLLPLKEYEEKLPENVTKAILRVIAQSLRDAKIVGQIDKKDKLARLIAQIPLSVLNIIMAKADTRTWSTAPESISFYSGRIDGPKLTILILDRAGNVIDSQHVKIDPNKINIINLRCFDNSSYAQSRCFDSSGGNRIANPSYTIHENLEHTTIAVQCTNIRNKATTSSRKRRLGP